jgi:ubiquinone biosynthesis protein
LVSHIAAPKKQNALKIMRFRPHFCAFHQTSADSRFPSAGMTGAKGKPCLTFPACSFPELAFPMKISLKPHHLKRYKDIAFLFIKYGSKDLARQFGFDHEKEADEPKNDEDQPSTPEQLANDLEKMGPTFIKLGQMLSTRPDLLPEPYIKALIRLQDKVQPFPFEDAEKIITRELGIRISKAFSYFDKEPVAAASLGQAHRAALRNGREVVVKVQRPGIREQIAEDFEVLEEIASFLDEHTELGQRYQFLNILAEFKRALLQELDYIKEAGHLNTLAENMEKFKHITVPLPVQDYCSREVLTMDYIHGTKITALSPVARLEMDGRALADELFQAYLQQVLIDGFFHADPHPGNIFLTEEHHIALLDLGMVGRLNPTMQEHLMQLLVSVSEGNGEDAVKTVLQICKTSGDFDEIKFRKVASELVAEQHDKSLAHQEIGKALLDVVKTAADTGLYVPSELSLLGKTLLQLEEVGKALCPDFDTHASVRRNVAQIVKQRMWKNVSSGRILGSMLELKDFVGGLPGRMNKLLDAAANAELEVNVRTPDARHLLNGFEKIANRITMGVILAALIIGASLLMQVNTSFQLMGYPGLAIICFLVAVAGGVWLVLSILLKDYRDRQKRRHENK